MNTKLEGSIGWTYYDDTAKSEVRRGIVRGRRELVFDVTYDGDRYAVSLKRVVASQYSGRWDLADGSTGNVDCTLYRSEDEVLLFGNWLEDGKLSHWWARLREVERFAGEVDTQDRNGNTVGSRPRVKALLGAKCREEKKGTSPIPSTKGVRRQQARPNSARPLDTPGRTLDKCLPLF